MQHRDFKHKCKCLFLLASAIALGLHSGSAAPGASADEPGVAVLLVDTDRVTAKVQEGIYGQFLEHINHSVVDGLFAEQIRGRGFEGKDFETYWKSFGEKAASQQPR